MTKTIHITTKDSYKNELFIHLIFWIIYLLFPLIKSLGRIDYSYNFKSELIDFGFGLIIFYTSYLFIFKLKDKIYGLVLLIVIFSAIGYCNFGFHNYLFGGIHTKAFWHYALSYFSTYTILSLFAYALFSSKEAYKKRLVLEEAISKKQEAELFSLKAQINPHFLFNTLNTIYSSALKNDEKVPEMILKISDNFRYVLNEGSKEYVTIEKEVVHIKDYISLQKERLADKISVDFNFDIDNYDQHIAPLLLITFVENAFKYSSALKGKQHKISITLQLKDKHLIFYCENAYNNSAKVQENMTHERSGIGLKNTRKRLDYLYAENHKLQIEDANGIYIVKLTIDL